MLRLGHTPILALLLAAALLPACDNKIKTSDEDIKQVQYKQLMTMLEARPQKKGVLAFLDSSAKKGPTILLDPRPEAKFAKAHLPNAVNIPLPKILENDERLADATNIVVYGSGWTDYISPAAAKRLMALGYRNVYDFRGGIELWKAEGGRVESNEPATQPK